MTAPSPAIFLDRDGTLHRDADYLIDFADFEPLPGVEEALRLLRGKGYRLFVVTNQSGVARGRFTLAQVDALNAKIREHFHAKGAEIEGFAVCPHHPGGTVPEYARECECRKPKPGMLLDLARKHGIDLARSHMVGDMPRDAMAGLAAGARAALIPPQEGAAELDNTGRLKEFGSLLDFAHSVRGADASHA